MDVLVFDNDLQSREVWGNLAAHASCNIRFEQVWNASDALSFEGLIVIDKSTLSDALVPQLEEAARRRPHQLLTATGSDFSVSEVVSIMRAGIEFVFEKPLAPRLNPLTFKAMIREATKRKEELEEYRKLTRLFRELTERELDVLEFVLGGHPNKKAAEELNVSVRTIEARRAKVYHKTESSCVVELVRKVDRLTNLEHVFEPKTSPAQFPTAEGGQVNTAIPTRALGRSPKFLSRMSVLL
ncbi:MAG: LuxR C-terminal-related transcriptional regulator [Planctomycetota bacterium]